MILVNTLKFNLYQIGKAKQLLIGFKRKNLNVMEHQVLLEQIVEQNLANTLAN